MSKPQHYFGTVIRTTIVLMVLLSFVADGASTPRASRSTTVKPAVADCVAPCIENFDNVTAPALPTGWTAVVATGQPGDLPWRTNFTSFDSEPNSASVETLNHATDIRLDSPLIAIGASGAILTFKKRHSLELLFDGMVLEISIPSVAGGAFRDITTAQGSFIDGGYNSFISTKANSAIAGRQAWTGVSPSGFTTTSVKLPDSARGQSVRVRWRVVTDESISSFGAFIDNVAFILPSNDNFSDAQPILGRSGIIVGSNVGATKETGEPNHAGATTGGASVWYKWQAPETGRFVFTTFNSGFRTVLAVYTGDTLPGTPVASNTADVTGCSPLFGDPAFSRVAFDAVGGVAYHIAVDTRSSSDAPGNIFLNWGASASITGRVSDVSGRPVPTGAIELHGDTCRRTESGGAVVFRDVPKGFRYDVDIRPASGTFANYSRWGTTASISPLDGDVSNYNFFQSSPTVSIKGTVTMPGNDTTNLQVTCVSNPSGITSTAPVDFVISQVATNLGGGNYQCSSLPINGDYVVTPAKLGFTFTPPNRSLVFVGQDLFSVNFTGAAAPPHTISGRVTLPDGTTGVSSVTIALSGSQTASQVTDGNGAYSFTGVPHGGNYIVTPANANFTFTPSNSTFNNLTADQTASFTADFVFQLILEESGQVAALDAMLHTRDPFPVINTVNLLNQGVDRNTRLVVFAAGLKLAPNEPASSVTINLVGSDNQIHEIPAEDVRPTSVFPFTQIIFRLPDGLPPGICTLAVKFHGNTTNIAAIRIRS